MRLPLIAAAALIAAPALGQGFDDAEKAEIDARIRDYLLANPEIIVEALEVLEQRQQNRQREADRELIARYSEQLFNDGYSHVAGDPEGEVEIVEFSDYRCSYCKQAHDAVKALLEAEDDVRFVIKEFPILGPNSTLAARVAMAAKTIADDATYIALNDALMSHRGELNEAQIFRIAGEAGLDERALRAEMENPQIAAHIRETYALARSLGVNGTPAFVIGERIVRGYVNYDRMRELVESAREAG